MTEPGPWNVLTAARAVRASWRSLRGPRRSRPPSISPRRAALTAAVEPIGPAVARLGDPAVLRRVAAALPPDAMWKNEDGGARWNGMDHDLNAAMYPLRWQGLLAASHAGAAHQFDGTPAIWAWEVGDPTWQAALDAIDVAMAVSALRLEGLPVTTGMAENHRLVLEIAADDVA